MTREWKAKTFKSGNSIALRLPKAAGFVEGEELVIVPHDDGHFSMWKKSDAKAVFMSLYGSMSPGFMKEGRGDIDQDDRSWDLDPNETKAA
ncbi:MAG: hypothetical protein RLZZ58_2085 [Pseudomonadota bacterium]